MNILVVDDEPLVRQSIAMLLRHAGCRVEVVDGPGAALALLTERTFEVVLTDFSMPEMTGDLLAARIKEMLPAQRIIMITAFVEESRIFSKPGGAIDGLLFKPFSYAKLKEEIERVLSDSTNGETDTVSGTAHPEQIRNDKSAGAALML